MCYAIQFFFKLNRNENMCFTCNIKKKNCMYICNLIHGSVFFFLFSEIQRLFCNFEVDLTIESKVPLKE